MGNSETVQPAKNPESKRSSEDTDKLEKIEDIKNPRQKTAALITHFATEKGWILKTNICDSKWENADILIDSINNELNNYQSENNSIVIRTEEKYKFIKVVLQKIYHSKEVDFTSKVNKAINASKTILGQYSSQLIKEFLKSA